MSATTQLPVNMHATSDIARVCVYANEARVVFGGVDKCSRSVHSCKQILQSCAFKCAREVLVIFLLFGDGAVGYFSVTLGREISALTAVSGIRAARIGIAHDMSDENFMLFTLDNKGKLRALVLQYNWGSKKIREIRNMSQEQLSFDGSAVINYLNTQHNCAFVSVKGGGCYIIAQSNNTITKVEADFGITSREGPIMDSGLFEPYADSGRSVYLWVRTSDRVRLLHNSEVRGQSKRQIRGEHCCGEKSVRGFSLYGGESDSVSMFVVGESGQVWEFCFQKNLRGRRSLRFTKCNPKLIRNFPIGNAGSSICIWPFERHHARRRPFSEEGIIFVDSSVGTGNSDFFKREPLCILEQSAREAAVELRAQQKRAKREAIRAPQVEAIRKFGPRAALRGLWIGARFPETQQRIATSTNYAIRQKRDNTVDVVNLEGKNLTHLFSSPPLFQCPFKVARVYFCSRSKIYIVAAKTGKIYKNLKNPKAFMPHITFPKFIDAIADEPGEDLVAIVARNGQITMYNEKRGKTVGLVGKYTGAKNITIVSEHFCVLTRGHRLSCFSDDFDIIWESEENVGAIKRAGQRLVIEKQNGEISLLPYIRKQWIRAPVDMPSIFRTNRTRAQIQPGTLNCLTSIHHSGMLDKANRFLRWADGAVQAVEIPRRLRACSNQIFLTNGGMFALMKDGRLA